MTTASEQLRRVALEWMETRDVIAQALRDYFGGKAPIHDDHAAGIIARLSHAGYSIEKIDLGESGGTNGANGSHGCAGGGPSNIGGGGGAPSVFADAGQHMVDTAAAHRTEIAALTKKLQEAEWRLAELDR